MNDGSQSTEPKTYLLRLLVAGMTSRSERTIHNLHKICHTYLADRYELEIVDIYQQPHLAEEYQVIAAPTLLKLRPLPLRRIIGDLSDEQRVLRGLDLSPADGEPTW